MITRFAHSSDLSNVKEFELRILNMESIIRELRTELESLKSQMSEDDLIQADRMYRYQHAIDEHFGMKIA